MDTELDTELNADANADPKTDTDSAETDPDLKAIGLQTGFIYGPVRSRRLGVSLGINPLPVDAKLCSMNCVYCQYSWTDIIRSSLDTPEDRRLVPPVETVIAELREVLDRMDAEGLKPDYLTLAGNGEPTLHPEFGHLVDQLLQVRAERCPDARIGILSNSLHLHRADVREALAKLDDRFMKLDAGDPETFKRVDVPGKVRLEDVIEGLKQLDDIVLQCLFIDGPINNTNPDALKALFARIAEIRPRSVQVYSLDRAPAYGKARRVPKERLEAIARDMRAATGAPVEVY